MSNRKFTRSRAIVLGLSLTPLGAQVVNANSIVEPAPVVDLSGLVAGDFGVGDYGLDSAVSGNVVDGYVPQGCDPSGCGVANYQINGFSTVDSLNEYGNVRTMHANVYRGGGAALADLRLDISVDPGSTAQIVQAPGCVIVSPRSVQCPVQGVGNYETREVAAILVAPGAVGWAYLTAVLHADVPGQNLGSSDQAYLSQLSATTPRSRFTRLEQTQCPFASADASFVQASGEAIAVDEASARLMEDGTFVRSQFGTPSIALSIALMLDDSAAVSPATWNAMKAAATGFVQDWASWAASKGEPMPSIAVYGMASNSRLANYSTDPVALNTAIQNADAVAKGTHFYASLGNAGVDLAGRSGRRAAIMLATGSDAGGAVLAESTKKSLISNGVNVYGVAVDASVEPLLRDIADQTHGFRQRADLDGGVYSALGKISGQIRAVHQLNWISPYTLSSYRAVTFDVQTVSGPSQIFSGYTPSAACSASCKVTRHLADGFGPYDSSPITLTLTPSPTEYTTISESIPYYMPVSAISNDGFYDSGSQMIYWDIPPGSAPVTLSYVVGGSGIVQTMRFAGFASTGGAMYSTCGDALLSPWPKHPASRYDSRITSDDLMRYRIAWFFGMPPDSLDYYAPINNGQARMAYVTRGYQVLRSQAAGWSPYLYQPGQSVPWLGPNVPAANIQSRQRELPATFIAGVPFSVLLSYTSSDPAGAGAIEEVPPAGWTVSNISDGGYYDARARTIRWGVVSDVASRTVSYTLTAPAGASAAVQFEGRVSIDGNEVDFAETTFGSTPAGDVIYRNGFDS